MNPAEPIVSWLRSRAPARIAPEDPNLSRGRTRHGVQLADIRRFVREWAREHKGLAREERTKLLDALYRGESIEERMIAGLLLAQWPAYRASIDLELLDRWIGGLEGWKEIDYTCQSVFGAADLLERWDEWRRFLVSSASAADVGRRRASLVLLVLPVRQSDDVRIIDLILSNVLDLSSESDKLVTKAISWVLREATKRHSKRVREFIEVHSDELPSVAVRETRRKIDTGKK